LRKAIINSTKIKDNGIFITEGKILACAEANYEKIKAGMK
jgi:hypothetical protein